MRTADHRLSQAIDRLGSLGFETGLEPVKPGVWRLWWSKGGACWGTKARALTYLGERAFGWLEARDRSDGSESQFAERIR